MFSHFNHFLAAQGSDLPFFSRKRCSNCAWAEYYLQQNTFRRYYAWADHYLWAVICRSRGGLSHNWKEGKNASNDKRVYDFYRASGELIFNQVFRIIWGKAGVQRGQTKFRRSPKVQSGWAIITRPYQDNLATSITKAMLIYSFEFDKQGKRT